MLTIISYAEPTFYRYKDKNGKIVITSALPEEANSIGYEIISPRGNVIETIPPPKSAAEIAAEEKAQEVQKQAETKAQEAKKIQELQAHKDEILLKAFSNEEDIIRSRDDKIASIAVLEGIAHENIVRLQKQLNEVKSAADTYQRQNQPIPENLQNAIKDTRRQINENQAFLDSKKVEKQQITANYQKLLERFQQIQTHPTVQQ